MTNCDILQVAEPKQNPQNDNVIVLLSVEYLRALQEMAFSLTQKHSRVHSLVVYPYLDLALARLCLIQVMD